MSPNWVCTKGDPVCANAPMVVWCGNDINPGATTPSFVAEIIRGDITLSPVSQLAASPFSLSPLVFSHPPVSKTTTVISVAMTATSNFNHLPTTPLDSPSNDAVPHTPPATPGPPSPNEAERYYYGIPPSPVWLPVPAPTSGLSPQAPKHI